MRERLGDVPIAVLEKGKQAGSHLLSGAVMNPSPLRELFRGRLKTADFPTYGEVPGEAVYVLTRRSALRIPPPPTMRNHGNLILSVSELGRFLSEQAEALGAVVLPETVRDEAPRRARPRASACGRAIAAADATVSSCRPSSRAATSSRGLTVLAEGTQGYLTGAAVDQFGLAGREPADLGARRQGGLARPQAAPEDRPHDGLAAADVGELRRVRRLVHLPDGRRPRDGRVRRGARVDGRRVLGPRRPAGVQDAPARLEDPRRRRAGRLGREDDHGGRLLLAPEPVQRARAPARRRGRGARQRAAPQGRPLRDRVGPARRRGGVPRAAARRGPEPRRRARLVRRVAPCEQAHEGAVRGAQHAPGVRQGLLRRRRARERDDGHEGPRSERPLPDPSERGRAA